MRYRKLEPEEHEKTRRLYETVFPEDTQDFVDYYYQWKTKNNQIYVAEDEKGIHGMLHLNPYEICWGEMRLCIHYIVAVATEASFRHQGLMRRLLQLAMTEMAGEKEAFTFLMPASTAIYTPFGFRTAWPWQWEEDVVFETAQSGQTEQKNGGTYRTVTSKDHLLLTQLAERVNHALEKKYSMFTWRSLEYYQDLCRQQKASAGEVQVLLKDGSPVCARCTQKEAFVPMMTRVLNLPEFVHHLRSRQEQEFILRVTDSILPANNGIFHFYIDSQGGRLEPVAAEKLVKTELETETVNISDLPHWLGSINPFSDAVICEVV